VSWADGHDLSPDERAVWEDRVRHALYSENARLRADLGVYACDPDESAGMNGDPED
jgi:hypothetical protein